MGVALPTPTRGSVVERRGTPNVYEAARTLIMMQGIQHSIGYSPFTQSWPNFCQKVLNTCHK